ncbi:MAG: hypothetical protein EOR77_21610 [Mesorhizobium sp.]|uniref:hypothetical protein n=1 Tax=Mesorhizobium sp. TaxID=1871066 RepID=UPI000FEAAF7C|nr:hypothetical protein [Mesorhizobium sp.]RWH86448.1 MAG: hypothetical protein EOQ87_26515 [Mesorhizobium sp.]RWM32272.1 MAG: hypothetical protein EOR77_21610 [Mesorhizobium sp.]TJV33772.1 MAG: hypothetical protein E5X87_10590 [Mesorhizobium sp.]
MTRCVVHVGNTNIIELSGLKSAIEDSYVNDADVIVTVKDAAGTNVSGQTWPAAMAYVADSDGLYRGILEDDLGLVDGTTYTAHIDADAGTNRIGHWEFAFVPKTRRGA